MKKIYLTEIHQHKTTFLAAKIDPRELVKLADDIEVGETQDAQRPLDKKRLEEIAAYIAENGEIPSSVIISTKKNEQNCCLTCALQHVTVRFEDGTEEKQELRYMLFPETPEEFARYKGTIDIIDGQHRLFSFRDGFRSPDLKDDEPFEILISIYELPVLKKRQMLFKTTNEKQKAVSPNLLLWLRRRLDLLTEPEKEYYPIVESLNYENCSPLQGRIIMSAERIRKGYRSEQLIRILKKSFPEVMILNSAPADDMQKFQIVCKYLHGWEQHYQVSFQTPGKETMTKISGIRYILWLMPTFWKMAKKQKIKWDDAFISRTISEFEQATQQDNLFQNSMIFRSEGATKQAVDEHIARFELWKAGHGDEEFNPMS